MKALIAAAMATAPGVAAQAPPVVGGTIAIMSARVGDSDSPALISTDAVAKAFANKGFTILNDPTHAAYSAEVVTTRTAVGTSVAATRSERPLATSGGVNIPISSGKSTLVPMWRTQIDIRVRRRGEQSVVWHGSAVTVRSSGARDGDADQVAFALGQAALSAYPIQTTAAISIP